MSLHYFKEAGPGTGFFDQSSIGFYFHPEDAEVKYSVARDGIAQMGWEIPPGHPNWKVGSSRIFEKPTILVSLHPHMHFRGESMKYTAYYPDGTKEVLLDVLRRLRANGPAVVMATHDISVAHLACGHACLLNRGQVAFGPLEQALTADTLKRTYGEHAVVLAEGTTFLPAH